MTGKNNLDFMQNIYSHYNSMSSEEKVKKLIEYLVKDDDGFLMISLVRISRGNWRFFDDERKIYKPAFELLKILKSEKANKYKKIADFGLFLSHHLIPAVEEYVKNPHHYTYSCNNFLCDDIPEEELLFLDDKGCEYTLSLYLEPLNELLLIREELNKNALPVIMARRKATQKTIEHDNIAKKINLTEIKEYFERYLKEFVINEVEKLSEVEKLFNLIECGEKFIGTEERILRRLKKKIINLKISDTLKSSPVVTNTGEIQKLEKKIKSLEKEILELRSLTKEKVSEIEKREQEKFDSWHVEKLLKDHWQEKMTWGRQICEMENRRKREIRDKDNQHEEEKINLFKIYIENLAEMEEKLTLSQTRLEKYHKKFHKHKKSNQLLWNSIKNTDLNQIENLKNQKKFLIKKTIELSDKAEELQGHLNLAYRNIYEGKEVKLLSKKVLELSDKSTSANTNYYNAVIDLVKEKSQARKASLALKKRALELKNDFDDKQGEVTNLQSKITRTEHDLGTSLDNLMLN